MLYNLHFDSYSVKGVFVSDRDFGRFFVTEWTDKEFPFTELHDLVINEDNITVLLSGDTKYRVYHLKSDMKCIYIISGPFLDTLSYLSFDDISSKNEFLLFSPNDFKLLLSKICELPNGNFVIGNVQDYISVIERMKNKYPNMETFFRGHYFYKYTLVPSLYRKKKYYDNESYMYMDFKTQFYNELSNKKYIEILTTMQHYRMPTRLLDTTSNPLVALYMACDKPTNYKNKGMNIGEVVIMNEDIRNVKYSDSNAVVLLSALAVLETNYKQELYERIVESLEKNDPSIYRGSLAYKRFVAEIATVLPGFDETFFTPEVLLRPRHVKVGMINERIIAQSGSFILFGLCNYVTGEYQPLKTVTKERVFIVNREYIQEQLNLLNINAGTMYPDKDHRSVSIMKSYE